MKKLVLMAALPLLSVCLVGCGPTATDTTNSVPPPSVEDTTAEIEKAAASGEIDPATYGQEAK